MLEGIRVLDLTWVLGGPFSGQLLAQLGAEVIKVEPARGDSSRAVPPQFFQGDSGFFLSVNRGKKSVVVDLKHSLGRDTFYDLVRSSHAVIYGFAPDVPKKLGIDFASLVEVNPKIVVGQMVGVHDQPPYTEYPVFDLIAQALGGIMSITGEEGGAPVRIGYQIADLAGGLYLALGTVAALLSAALTGRGRHVQVSLLDCQLALLTWQAQNYFISGDVPLPLGSRHAMIAPSEVFFCSDGKPLALSNHGEELWRRLCAALGRDDLAKDPRFATAADRLENVKELSGILQQIFRLKTREEWAAALFEKRLPVAPVLNVAEAVSQPLASLRQMVERIPHPRTGEDLRFLGNPFKYEAARPLSYPPELGVDTADVLHRLCGYDADKIAALARAGAIETR
jgi:crotonobetainyl-CoA:carnitine CoA-transferase CaiB-like acyl-CoA transferase